MTNSGSAENSGALLGPFVCFVSVRHQVLHLFYDLKLFVSMTIEVQEKVLHPKEIVS